MLIIPSTMFTGPQAQKNKRNKLLDACPAKEASSSVGGLDELLPFVFPNNPDGFVMVLAGYFDESVREDGDAPICVGGFLFKAERYKRFQERWRREVLRLPNPRRHLKHFHMTDLCAGYGVYRGLDIPTRVGILKRAVDVVSACADGTVGVHFKQAEFEAHVTDPADWATYRGSIYAQACSMCVQIAAMKLSDWGWPHAEVLYVFERGHKSKNEADEMLKAIAASDAFRKRFRYRNHLFEEKDKECGLQAADLLVWVMTKADIVRGGAVPPAFMPFVDNVIRLSEALPKRRHMSVFTGEMLRRYLVEQSSEDSEYIPVNFPPRRKASLR